MLLKKKSYTQLKFVYVVYIVVFDVEPALENVKLTILERLELQSFFTHYQA